jgi:HEPN domain-containing protein
MPPPPATTPAGKAEARRFLHKAEEFLRAALPAQQAGHANAAGVLAIHAGILACDALTAHDLGKRSKSGRHHDVLQLIAHVEIPEKAAVARQLRQLLDAKNMVEYDDQMLIAGDEDKMVEAAKRIVEVARRRVKP